MNPTFAEHATSHAFGLTLSRAMIESLRMVVERRPERSVLWGRDLDALVRRGLVVCRYTVNLDPKLPPTNREVLPTRAGRLVWALLRETGQVPGGKPDPMLREAPKPPSAQIDRVEISLKPRVKSHG